MAELYSCYTYEYPKTTESRTLERRHILDEETIKQITSHFYHQIRHGCGNAACQTSTCLTFKRKRATEPLYRTPTILSARAMAACLAASPNPRARLCPYGHLRSDDPLDQAFPLAKSDPRLKRYMFEVATNGKSEPAAVEPIKDLDKKSLVQLLFNSDSWMRGRTSSIENVPNAVINATNALGLELRLNPRHYDPTFLCAGLDALCDFLPQVGDKPDDGQAPLLVWQAWVELRKRGRFLLDLPESRKPENRSMARACVELADRYQDENALRLLRQVLRGFSVWAYEADESTENNAAEFEILGFLAPDSAVILPLLRKNVAAPKWHSDHTKRLAPTAHVILEWCRVMLQREWDNKAVFSWSSLVGCAVEFMSFLYRHRQLLEIDKKLFETPYLFKRMDFMEVPRSWIEDTVPENHGHLLSYPWLFSVSGLVTYFRSINHLTMSRAVNASVSLQYLINRHKILVDSHDDQILDRLRTAKEQVLALEIKRHHILEDAMNELWRRQKRELRRPLKVRMGMDEGEEGVDFGGVQQEFFRLSLGEALDSDYGLFTTDETTRMTWFLPCSKAPLHHFVLVGILVGLAVYNGITLSVTFPEALYRKLLGEPVETLDHIRDGWPVLTKGLRYLLDYADDDVGDVFMRSYVFSAETNGTTVSADMALESRDVPWPPPTGLASSTDVEAAAPLVTNANRDRYVADYVFWLTDKAIRPQYEAFARGFFMCVDRAALRLFDAPGLRNLTEGSQRVDVDALQRTAAYDNGYHPAHPVVRHFWHVVRSFSDAEVRTLLEFVTASDRVPAKGIEEIVFIVQRNGRDDERLPTSQTCFGRLLLPEYSSREVLERKLRQAMVHSLGFYLQ